MTNLFQFLVFIFFSIYAFLKATSYGIYEFKQNNNKLGGIIVIIFSLFCVVTSIFALFVA